MASDDPITLPRLSRGIVVGTLILLVALAVWPVVWAGYPTLGDGLIHYYRLVEFDHLLRQGVWFPRWAPDLGYGYGIPVFNYYPPLTYYLGALFHTLGLSFAPSLLAVYVLAWTLAVTGAYTLAHDRWGTSSAGLIAAAAYGLAPYLYFNALARGALPETLGLGLLPWVLWGMGRLRAEGGRLKGTAVLIAAGLMAALWLTHLLTAVMALPLILLIALTSPQPQARHLQSPSSSFHRPLLACLLGLGLAAYSVLPALLETGYVQVERLTGPSDLDFRSNFLNLAELLAWPRAFDPRLVFHVVPPSLSLAALGLAVLGFARAWRRGPRPNASDAALWAALGLFAVLTLPITRPVWEWLPLAAVAQFPWRLAGPASLRLALLAGRASPIAGRLAPPLALAALWLFSLAWTFAPGFAAPPAPATTAGLAQYERATGQLGTTSTGEFLPVGVRELPPADGLSSAYAQSAVIPRLNTLPPGVTLQSQSATVTSASATINAAAPATLTFDLFFFPGWRATVDGRAVPIAPSHPDGFITVPVPAGGRTVTVRFGPTPLRVAAAGISFLAVVAVAAIAARARSLRRHQPASASLAQSPIPHRQPLVVPLALLALLLFRIGFIDGRETVFARTRFDGAAVAGVDAPLDVNFDDQLVLLGYDAPGLTLPADGELSLTLYWRAQTVPAVDYSTTVQALDTDGNIWGQADSQHPGRLPTSRWRTDQYALDTHALGLLPGAPPGDYELFVGVYRVDGPALNVLDAERAPRGQLYRLGTLTVTGRASPLPWPDGPDLPLAHPLGPLTAWAPGPMAEFVNGRAPQAGDDIVLTVMWQASGALRPNVVARWELVHGTGRVLSALDAQPAHTDYPTSAWRAGELIRGVNHLRVPAQTPAGPAAVQLSLLDAPTGARLGSPVTVATVTITVPERSFAMPPVDQRVDASIGESVVLLGYNLDPATGTLTLYWQPSAPLDESYTAFVHALGPDGALLAQVDQIPAAGARPTTGWLSGEVIADAYTLPLTGATALRTGLYDPQTGARLGETLMPIP